MPNMHWVGESFIDRFTILVMFVLIVRFDFHVCVLLLGHTIHEIVDLFNLIDNIIMK